MKPQLTRADSTLTPLRALAAAGAALAALLLTGCGQPGPLYLPPAVSAPAAQPGVAPAASAAATAR